MWPVGAEGAAVSLTLMLGGKGREPPQLLRTWRIYSAPRGIWDNFRSCYGDRSPREDSGLNARMKTLCVRGKNRGFGESGGGGGPPPPPAPPDPTPLPEPKVNPLKGAEQGN